MIKSKNITVCNKQQINTVKIKVPLAPGKGLILRDSAGIYIFEKVLKTKKS